MNEAFEKINIADCLVIITLAAALILAIFYGMNELAMSIASRCPQRPAAGWAGRRCARGFSGRIPAAAPLPGG